MASLWFKKAGELIVASTLDMVGDNLRCIILSDAYVPSLPNDAFVSDIVASEIAGASRSANLAGKTFNYNGGSTRWEFKHTAPTFGSPGAGPTIGFVVIYKFVTNDADSPVLICDDITPDVPTTGGLVTYNPPADGHWLNHV